MNIKNYTSTVPATSSIAKIQQYLVEAGASDISMKYDTQTKQCVAITFRMVIPNQLPMFFRLPANVEACFKMLWAEVKRPQPTTKASIQQQAERTAWKIICDWVQIQLSMIQLQQAEPLQVFLSYAYDASKDQTFFEQVKEGGYKALLPSSN